MVRFIFLAILIAISGCHDNADDLGVGAECTSNDQCDTKNNQVCLMQFRGGYCGLEGCVHDADCPDLSACIVHTDGNNYCFRTCVDKPECNANRSTLNESNCSSNVTFVDGAMNRKACVPPS